MKKTNMYYKTAALVINALAQQPKVVLPSDFMSAYIFDVSNTPLVVDADGTALILNVESNAGYVRPALHDQHDANREDIITYIGKIRLTEAKFEKTELTDVSAIHDELVLRLADLLAFLGAIYVKGRSDELWVSTAVTTDSAVKALGLTPLSNMDWSVIDSRLDKTVAGLVMLFGFTQGGKTTLARKAAGNSAAFVRWSEPTEQFESAEANSETVIRVSSFNSLMLLTSVLVASGQNVINDSYRLTYSLAGGGAVIQGLNADFALVMTAINNFFSVFDGGRVLATMNPIYALDPSGDEDIRGKSKELVSVIKIAMTGSLAGFVSLENYQVNYVSARLNDDTRFESVNEVGSGRTYSEVGNGTGQIAEAMDRVRDQANTLGKLEELELVDSSSIVHNLDAYGASVVSDESELFQSILQDLENEKD